jgi:hypothetical protein
MNRRPLIAGCGNRVQVPPGIDGTTSLGFISQAEPLSPVRPEQDGQIEPAVPGIEVGRTGAGHGPVHDAGQPGRAARAD